MLVSVLIQASFIHSVSEGLSLRTQMQSSQAGTAALLLSKLSDTEECYVAGLMTRWHRAIDQAEITVGPAELSRSYTCREPGIRAQLECILRYKMHILRPGRVEKELRVLLGFETRYLLHRRQDIAVPVLYLELSHALRAKRSLLSVRNSPREH